MLPAAWLNAIRSWAALNEDVLEVWLFGSRAKGANRDESDVDLAVATLGVTQGERLAAFIHLEEPPHLPVQAAVMPLDDDIVAAAVREHGVLLYARK